MAFVDPLPRRDRPRVFRISAGKWAVSAPGIWIRRQHFETWAEALDYANTVASAIRMTPVVPPATWPTTPIQPMRPFISPPSDRTNPVYPYWNPQVWCSTS